ncbi:YciI family protein [Novosphingobium sp. 9U]|uniref:YciI family protein n=1 Tax=Novosphingobium sp. 9U TaxID=2653158 RepID=UPI0012F44FB3|nr:YciI family protein [Novosphingobium sp. 9U]VWX50581.1 conserved hypothetical protein [Novosphingobium sp. 9U]
MNPMYIVLITYIRPIEEVDARLRDHATWVREGLADGVFVACGREPSRTGGVIVARGESRPDLEARLTRDPFQMYGLATNKIVPFEATIAIDSLQANG